MIVAQTQLMLRPRRDLRDGLGRWPRDWEFARNSLAAVRWNDLGLPIQRQHGAGRFSITAGFQSASSEQIGPLAIRGGQPGVRLEVAGTFQFLLVILIS